MELSVEEFVDQLLSKEALDQPSDAVKPENLDIQLPKWFDEKKYNQGCRFYQDNYFGMVTASFLGLIGVFAVPSILKVLVESRRSSSTFTAYKRYISTFEHISSWFFHEMKPGSFSWKSITTVRSRHFQAGYSSKKRGGTYVSQRDIAITLWGLIGFPILKPDKLGIRQMEAGDWEAFNLASRTVGHMLGLEDRYNICRNTIEETRQVCQLILERVYTPCLENVPEYFEHMSYVMLDGMWSINTSIDIPSMLYWTRYMADVPGYIFTEEERVNLEQRLREKLKGKPLDSGVDSATLVSKCYIEGLTPRKSPRLLYLRDYQTLNTVPDYNNLPLFSRFNLCLSFISMYIYSTYLGRLYLNFSGRWSKWMAVNFPYIAYLRFGYRKAMVNIFAESSKDDTNPKKNEDYYKERLRPWYSYWVSLIW